MRTLNYEIVDEIRVVRSVGFPTVDPMASVTNAVQMVRSTEAGEAYREMFERARELVSTGEAGQDALKTMRQEILETTYEYQKKCYQYAQENPVWFDTIPGEKLVENDAAETAISKLKNKPANTVLTIEGNLIPDNRGRTMHRFDHTSQRWESRRVNLIGETLSEGWNWSDDLTDDQLVAISFQQERERIANMTPEQKAALMESEIDVAAKRCAQLRSTLEIKGEVDALDIARKQYEDLKREIEIKYGLRTGEVSNGGSKEGKTDASDRNGSVRKGTQPDGGD